MNNLIKEKLTEYLEFDPSYIFNNTDYLVVFGGAIRDIIAGKSEEITDVDILCLSISRDKMIDELVKNEYINVDLHRPELYEMYRHIHHIFEPQTFMKGRKIVQLITPSIVEMPRPYHKRKLPEAQKRTFFYLLSNVDLITSGAFYDGYDVYESIKGSISWVKSRYTHRIINNSMYDGKRIIGRLHKLEKKGYLDVDDYKVNRLGVERLIKIDTLKYKYPQMIDFQSRFENDQHIFKQVEYKPNIDVDYDNLDSFFDDL